MAVQAEFRDNSRNFLSDFVGLGFDDDVVQSDTTAFFRELLYAAGAWEDFPTLAALLEKNFSSTEAVLEATAESLLAAGLSHEIVSNARLIIEIGNYITQCKREESYSSPESIVACLAAETSLSEDEKFSYIFKRRDGNVSCVYTTSAGESLKLGIVISEIIRKAILNDAVEIYVAHSHLTPSPPSEQDLFECEKLRTIMNAYSVQMVDFYLFTGDCFSFESAFNTNKIFCRSLISQEEFLLIL